MYVTAVRNRSDSSLRKLLLFGFNSDNIIDAAARLLRHHIALIFEHLGEVPKLAEGTPLERVQVGNSGARVQIPPSPRKNKSSAVRQGFCFCIEGFERPAGKRSSGPFDRGRRDRAAKQPGANPSFSAQARLITSRHSHFASLRCSYRLSPHTSSGQRPFVSKLPRPLPSSYSARYSLKSLLLRAKTKALPSGRAFVFA